MAGTLGTAALHPYEVFLTTSSIISSSITASYLNPNTYQITSSWSNNVVSSSYANNTCTSSYSLSSSNSLNSITSSYSLNANSSSYANSGSYSLSGSHASNANCVSSYTGLPVGTMVYITGLEPSSLTYCYINCCSLPYVCFGSITIPTNTYSKILLTAEMQGYNGSAANRIFNFQQVSLITCQSGLGLSGASWIPVSGANYGIFGGSTTACGGANGTLTIEGFTDGTNEYTCLALRSLRAFGIV